MKVKTTKIANAAKKRPQRTLPAATASAGAITDKIANNAKIMVKIYCLVEANMMMMMVLG